MKGGSLEAISVLGLIGLSAVIAGGASTSLGYAARCFYDKSPIEEAIPYGLYGAGFGFTVLAGTLCTVLIMDKLRKK